MSGSGARSILFRQWRQSRSHDQLTTGTLHTPLLMLEAMNPPLTSDHADPHGYEYILSTSCVSRGPLTDRDED